MDEHRLVTSRDKMDKDKKAVTICTKHPSWAYFAAEEPGQCKEMHDTNVFMVLLVLFLAKCTNKDFCCLSVRKNNNYKNKKMQKDKCPGKIYMLRVGQSK